MARGSRHSKNAGTMGSEALTYHERRALGFGTVKERLGKDSQNRYNDCSLTLQPAVRPVATEHGHIFSKEAILSYYVDQRKEKQRQMEAWEAEQARLQRETDEKAELKKHAEVVAFERQNTAVASDRTSSAILKEYNEQAQHMHDRVKTMSSGFSIQANEQRARSVKSFWQAQDTPNSEIQMAKPSMEVLCPACGKKLNMKRLIDVKFADAPEGADGLHMDPVSKDIITNASKLVLIKPTGDVLLEETYNKCIKPDGRYNGRKLKATDVIKLQSGGTGFAEHDGDKLQSGKHTLLGPGSGRADVRGQHVTGKSRFGLSFQN